MASIALIELNFLPQGEGLNIKKTLLTTLFMIFFVVFVVSCVTCQCARMNLNEWVFIVYYNWDYGWPTCSESAFIICRCISTALWRTKEILYLWSTHALVHLVGLISFTSEVSSLSQWDEKDCCIFLLLFSPLQIWLCFEWKMSQIMY